MERNNPTTDWFINSKSQHFHKIIEISKKDSANLSDADVLIFLQVNKNVHKEFLVKRNRSSEVSENIYDSQQIFLESSIDYTKNKKKKIILIEQENNLSNIVQLVIDQLIKQDIIVQNV